MTEPLCPECDGILDGMLGKRLKCMKCHIEYLLHKVPPLKTSSHKICVICDTPFRSNYATKTCSKECSYELRLLHHQANRDKRKS